MIITCFAQPLSFALELSSMEYLIFFLFIFAGYFIQKEINKLSGNFAGKIEEVNQELDEIKEELNELRNKVEYQDLTELEKEEIAFEKAKDISIKIFEKLKKGQKVSLISGSYYYPNENIHISRFEYKYDHIDYDNKELSLI